MSTVERGELITYVVVSGSTLVLSASEVFAAAGEEFNLVTNNRLKASQEGVVWIRGWHTRDSNEGKALLAAVTMMQEPASIVVTGAWPVSGLSLIFSTIGSPQPNSSSGLYMGQATPPTAPALRLPHVVMVGSTK
jgi:hypothetical protein